MRKITTVSSEFEIPSNLQVPGRRSTKSFAKENHPNSKYPFRTMRVGESFTVSGETERNNATSAACHFVTRNNPDMKFGSSPTSPRRTSFRIFRVA